MSTQSEALRRFVGSRTRDAETPVQERSGGRVVIVGGGKGGVGTSTVAALLAISAAESGHRVLLVDGDEFAGVQHLMFGVMPSFPLAALRGGDVLPQDLVIPVASTLHLLPGGASLDSAPITPPERRALFRRVSSLYDQYDLVVADGGSRLDSVLSLAAAGVERVVAVTTTDRIATAATYALVKAVHARHAGLPIEVVVNGHDDPLLPAAPYQQIAAGALSFLQRSVALGGTVPHDPSLRAAVGEGMTVQDAAHGSPAALALGAVAARLLGSLTPSHSLS